MEATLEQTKTRKSTSPKLTCVITGKTRSSNEKYLAAKAQDRNVSVEDFTQYYACKQAVKRLRAGMSVQEARADLSVQITTPVSEEDVKTILSLNGKSKR